MSYTSYGDSAGVFAFDSYGGLPSPGIIRLNAIDSIGNNFTSYFNAIKASTSFFIKITEVATGNWKLFSGNYIYDNTAGHNNWEFYSAGNGGVAQSSVAPNWINGASYYVLFTVGSPFGSNVYNMNTIPAASVAGLGVRAFVNDATYTDSINFAGQYYGGGNGNYPVYSDGLVWRYG
jgi:hypothetical protein